MTWPLVKTLPHWSRASSFSPTIARDQIDQTADMEDPFDQVGLDDIKLEEFHFAKEGPLLEKPAP